MNNAGESVGTDHGVGEVDVPKTNKERYRQLKRRFKFLVYENECYQEELRNLQRKLLKLSRDKNFLLDRLLPYEKLSESSDDSDASISKTEEKKPKKKPRAPQQRKRPSTGANAAGGARPNTNAATAGMKLASEMHASISAGALQTGPDAKKPKIEDLVAFPQATPEQRIDANQLAYEPVCGPICYVQVCEGCKDLTVSVGTGRTTVKLVGRSSAHPEATNAMGSGPVSCGPISSNVDPGFTLAPSQTSAMGVGDCNSVGPTSSQHALGSSPVNGNPSANNSLGNIMSAPPADLLQC